MENTGILPCPLHVSDTCQLEGPGYYLTFCSQALGHEHHRLDSTSLQPAAHPDCISKPLSVLQSLKYALLYWQALNRCTGLTES